MQSGAISGSSRYIELEPISGAISGSSHYIELEPICSNPSTGSTKAYSAVA